MTCPKISRIYDPFKIEESEITAVFKVHESDVFNPFKILESAVFCMPANRRVFIAEREPTLFIQLERTYQGFTTERKNTGAISPHE